MAEDAKMYRERSQIERDIAAATELPNVRDRALRSANRWDELAVQAERAKAGAEERRERAANPFLNS